MRCLYILMLIHETGSKRNKGGAQVYDGCQPTKTMGLGRPALVGTLPLTLSANCRRRRPEGTGGSPQPPSPPRPPLRIMYQSNTEGLHLTTRSRNMCYAL